MVEPAKATILVVDDNDEILEFLTSQLERRGYVALPAGAAGRRSDGPRRRSPI